MELKCFSIWDDKAKAFIAPFFFPQDGQAVRTFKDCVNDKAHAFGRNPHDYSLFRVGLFDDNNGRISAAATGPELLVTGLDCLDRGAGASAQADLELTNGSDRK